MGGMFGGGGGGDDGGWNEIAQALQQAIQQGPSYNPYQQFGGGGAATGGAPSLLGGGGTSGLIGGTSAGSRGSEPTPTGGWQGSGNSQFIPGAANQLLRMGNSPQYNWY